MGFARGVWQYNEIGDKAYSVVKYLGTGGNIVIPSSVNGKPVAAVGKGVFGGNSTVISVTIPSSILQITERAFENCGELKQVLGCAGLNLIGKQAFFGCSKLERIPLGTVSVIGQSAFSGCLKLNNISLTNVKSIGKKAFYSCVSLSEVKIPSCTETLEEDAFGECAMLSSVWIPESLYTPDRISSTFGGTPFCNQTQLMNKPTGTSAKQHNQHNHQNQQKPPKHSEQQSVITPDGYTLVSSGDGTWAVKDYSGSAANLFVASKRSDGRTVAKILPFAFGSSKVQTVYIGEGITEIEPEAFYGCSSLIYAELPDSLKTLGSNAFEYCSRLINVRLPRSLDNQAQIYASFLYTPFIQARTGKPIENGTEILLHYEDGIWSLKKYIGHLNEVTLKSKLSDKAKITRILPQAFRCRQDVKKVIISEGYTEICTDAFAECGSLKKVVIPGSIMKIEPNAFRGCTALTDVKLPPRLVNLNVISASFIGTPFGDRIKKELEGAAATGVKLVNNSDDTWSLERYTGSDKVVIIRSVIAGKTITNILNGAFAGRESIISVFIGDGITEIKPRAFQGCGSLSFIALPKTLTEIGREAFSGCEKLERVLLPAKLGTPEIIKEVFVGTPVGASFDMVSPSFYSGADMVLICAKKSCDSPALDLKEIVNSVTA